MARAFRRWTVLVIGWTLVVAGAIILPLPIPTGLLMLVIGFALLSRESPMVRRWIAALRARFPRPFDALEDGWAEVSERLRDWLDANARDGVARWLAALLFPTLRGPGGS